MNTDFSNHVADAGAPSSESELMAPEVKHEEPVAGGSFTRDLTTGRLIKAVADTATADQE